MSKKILIVDDSQFMRSLIRENIPGREKYEILEASSGTDAREQFRKENPDLTFLVIIMPDGEEEGVRVLRYIKERDPEANIVMISAVARDTVIEECKGLGVEDYIIKPFESGSIVQAVKKYLG